MRKRAGEEVEPLYASRMQATITQTADEALSDIFQTGFELLNGGMEINSYLSIELVLTKTDQNGVLHCLFD